MVDCRAANVRLRTVVQVMDQRDARFYRGRGAECAAQLDPDVRDHQLVGGNENRRLQLLRRFHDGQKIPDVRVIEGRDGKPSRIRGPEDRPHVQLLSCNHAYPFCEWMNWRASSRVGILAVAPTALMFIAKTAHASSALSSMFHPLSTPVRKTGIPRPSAAALKNARSCRRRGTGAAAPRRLRIIPKPANHLVRLRITVSTAWEKRAFYELLRITTASS